MANLSQCWDNFINNPYTENSVFNEQLFNELLHKSMNNVIISEEQFESIHESFENSKSQNNKLKMEKKQIEDKGGRKQRSIQEELRLKQVIKEIKSSKMRYKRQGNKMRRTQKFSLTLTNKLEKLLISVTNNDNNNMNKSTINRVHWLLIAFCINTLSEMQSKFASAQENIEQIYNYLLNKKHQTKPLFTSLLKWVHSYNDSPVNIVKIFNNSDTSDLWILYIICCAFPALFINISINILNNKQSLHILLHNLLPKYPIVTLKIINSYVEYKEINKLKMILKICQFHPSLWDKIVSQPFVKQVFDLLVKSMDNNKGNEKEICLLLFNFEHLMIDNDELANKYSNYLSDIIVKLDDFDKYINHNININDVENASEMLSLCNKFKRLKECDLSLLIKHKNIIKVLCLMDDRFLFNTLVQLITNYDSIESYLNIFDMNKFIESIKNDIDIIAYYSLKHKKDNNNMGNTIKNLCFICEKFKLKFMINSTLLGCISHLLEDINSDLVKLLNHINVQKLPKNVGILLCNYCFKGVIKSESNKHLKHSLIELILKLCEYDTRISKEPIELCISYILCPELNGVKITKLKPKEINKNKKQKHTKILTPKIRINPYANALLKQIDKPNIHKFEKLQKIINSNSNHEDEKKQESSKEELDNNKENKSKQGDDTNNLCWYLLSKLCKYFVPYLSEFIQQILPGTHLEPSQSRYSESIQKWTVLMFDHDVLILFETYPDLLIIIELFCINSKICEDNSTHHTVLVYLRSLCVSYYIKCTKYTKALKVNGSVVKKWNKKEEYEFYCACNVIFECVYLSGKISLRLYKMVGLLFDLDLHEIGRIFRHICSLCLQPQNQMIAKSSPSFPLKLNTKMLEAEKRVIRQILLQNTDLMSKHTKFGASILIM